MVIYATLPPISQFFLIKPRFFHFFACEGGFFCYIHIIASNGANANRPKGQTKEREPMTQSKQKRVWLATPCSESQARMHFTAPAANPDYTWRITRGVIPLYTIVWVNDDTRKSELLGSQVLNFALAEAMVDAWESGEYTGFDANHVLEPKTKAHGFTDDATATKEDKNHG